MILDDLKDQLTEKLQSSWAQFQESSTYISISEKYADLSPNGQKLARAGAALLIILILLVPPYTYLSSSQAALMDFQYNRDLIRQLFRVTRASQELASAPRQLDGNQVRSQVDQAMLQFALPPDNKMTIVPYNATGPGISAGIPQTVNQSGVEVTLQKVNVRQLVDIGARLHNLDKSIKMIGMEVLATPGSEGYFNVKYKLVAFMMPEEKSPPQGGPKKPGPRNKPGAPSDDT